MDRELIARRILNSRRDLIDSVDWATRSSDAAEGGCGVLGLACNVPIAGRHVVEAAAQMHNRGNGKGGGIAMAGLDPGQMGVSPETLRSAYLVQIAYLDPDARREVEEKGLASFDLAQGYRVAAIDDWRAVPGLAVRPPEVWRYFARVKPDALDRFAESHGLDSLSPRAVEDEFVYQNSFQINQEFYASLGEKRAFVLCHGRDLIVLKIVGYAEQVIQYYRLDDLTARVRVAHQRYPTKGRVWHPGGAHPFIGLNEALVHNGDFANYHAVSEYLRQRNIASQFLTDTEVSVQLFDLWDRIYGYPLEVTLEALAPTTERDFAMLPPERQALYRAVQATHTHASPDGPWFFIVARSHPDREEWQLLGITDTSMLRPQVFALYENAAPTPCLQAEANTESPRQGGDNGVPSSPLQTGEGHGGVKLGLVASERQAINAALRSLAAEDARFLPQADRYWVARGGSHTDGGAFVFTVRTDDPEAPGKGSDARGWTLNTADKFGQVKRTAAGQRHVDQTALHPTKVGESYLKTIEVLSYYAFDDGGPSTMLRLASERMAARTFDEIVALGKLLIDFAAAGGDEWEFARQTLTLLRDRHYDPGDKRRASLLTLFDTNLTDLFNRVPGISESTNHRAPNCRVTWDNRHALRPPATAETTLVVDTLGFPPEGDASAARLLVAAYELGWRHMIAYNWRGGRFAACGLGPQTEGVRLELYGDVGDYAAHPWRCPRSSGADI